MKPQTLQPIKIFVISGMFTCLCMAGLLGLDTLLGSQEFLMQLTYGSKKEILLNLIENGLRLFIIMFFSALFTHALYTVNKLFGRLMLVASLALAYYLLQYNASLLLVFYISWLLNLLFIRGVRL
ncbi:hypothetical protein KO489_08975 [Reinekea forsetii]|nr:hypothetical protein [Reinekea forsetii]